MDETNNAVNGPASEQGPASNGKEGITSHDTGSPVEKKSGDKLYTEQEYKQGISNALAEAGRKHKPVADELATVKSQLATMTSQLDDLSAEKTTLEESIEELAKDDPERKNLVQKLKDLNAQERKLKAERLQIDSEKQEVTKWKRQTTLGEIAGEFQDGDTEELEKACDDLGIGSEPERIRAVAALKWKPLPNSQLQTPNLIIPDSGATNGGAVDFSKKSAEELYNLGLKAERNKKK
jgi:uncharacterized phage infection (PIP) family protein YhgE